MPPRLYFTSFFQSTKRTTVKNTSTENCCQATLSSSNIECRHIEPKAHLDHLAALWRTTGLLEPTHFIYLDRVGLHLWDREVNKWVRTTRLSNLRSLILICSFCCLVESQREKSLESDCPCSTDWPNDWLNKWMRKMSQRRTVFARYRISLPNTSRLIQTHVENGRGELHYWLSNMNAFDQPSTKCSWSVQLLRNVE